MGKKPFLILKKRTGQALVEYLIIFSFMSLVAINMVKGLDGFMNDSMGGLAYELTQQLSVGICERDCYYPKYKN